MNDLDYEERDYGEMVLAEAEESAEIIEREKMLDERIDEVTEQSYAKGKASAQDEIDELVNMLLYCNPVPAKKTQYEALMDKHRVNKPHDSWCKSQIGEFCNCGLSLDKHRGK